MDPDVAFKSPKLGEIGIEQRLGQPIMAAAEFTDESGKKIRLKSLLGKRPVLILPIFYRCTGVCYLELTGVVDMLVESEGLKIGRDLDVVSLGINPKETYELARAKKAETLRSYGRETDKAAWHFLTGTQENLNAVTTSLGFKYRYNAEKDEVSHPSGIMLLTADGTIASYLLGARYDAKKFAGLLALAAKNEVGQKSTELFFGCIHIDPVTGERRIVVEKVLRVLGVLTVAGIVLSILVMNGKVKLPFRNRRQSA
jgi:protein SCO1/2